MTKNICFLKCTNQNYQIKSNHLTKLFFFEIYQHMCRNTIRKDRRRLEIADEVLRCSTLWDTPAFEASLWGAQCLLSGTPGDYLRPEEGETGYSELPRSSSSMRCLQFRNRRERWCMCIWNDRLLRTSFRIYSIRNEGRLRSSPRRKTERLPLQLPFRPQILWSTVCHLFHRNS